MLVQILKFFLGFRVPFKFLLVSAKILLAGAAVSQEQVPPAYVGSSECRNCHLNEAREWDLSHHAKAWTKPSADSVVADFSDTQFTHQGVTTKFSIQNGDYVIETQGPDGVQTQYKVAGVAGFTPLQQFLLETSPGQLQSFDITWDDEKKRWYHLYPDQDLPAGDGFHWGGSYKNWNARCAECHATGFEKQYDAIRKTYASRQSEIGVGCEACHGPGEAHLEWAMSNGSPNLLRWSNLSDTGFTMDFTVGPEAEIQQCASCHSRREPMEAGNPLPGTPFHDAYRLATLQPNLYYPDGQILDEVYVYGSFLQSKMYGKGVSCTDCHNAHTGETLTQGNALCSQCHTPAGNPDFPSLPLKIYDGPAHHFHAEDSAGAQCVNCHMVSRDYMQIDGRRDHSFRIPRPDLSLTTLAPNACTDCHTDQTNKWASDTVEAWFPNSANRGKHFSQVLAASRTSPETQIEELIGIVAHTELPGIVRASALDILTQLSTPDVASRVEFALTDTDPLVRVSAIAAQRGANPNEIALRLASLLEDPVRAVRVAAARAYLPLPIAHLPNSIANARNRAMVEWQSSIMAKADFPEAQLVIAGMALTTRRMDAALAAFGEAVEMDPQLEQAWSMIVRIQDAIGDRQEALRTVEAAILANPDSVNLHLMKADLLR